jgi:hypothetical protein
MSGLWRCVGAGAVVATALVGLVGGLEIVAGRFHVDSSSTFIASKPNDVADLGQDFLNPYQGSWQTRESGPTEGRRISEDQ